MMATFLFASDIIPDYYILPMFPFYSIAVASARRNLCKGTQMPRFSLEHMSEAEVVKELLVNVLRGSLQLDVRQPPLSATPTPSCIHCRNCVYLGRE